MLHILEFFEDVKKHLNERDGKSFSGFRETLSKIREERFSGGYQIHKIHLCFKESHAICDWESRLGSTLCASSVL